MPHATEKCPTCGGPLLSPDGCCPQCGSARGGGRGGPNAQPAKPPIRMGSVAGCWTIGGDVACDLVVDLPTVSARHCRLTRTGEGYLLEDLNSTNGTFVNGQRIASTTPVSPADRITLGRAVPMPWPAETRRPDISAIRIGRHPDNDVVLDYPMVSAHHARLAHEAGSMWIEDLGSRNGTAIGSPDNRIQRSPVNRDDIVFFGSLRVPMSRLIGEKLTLGIRAHTLVGLARRTVLIGRDEACDLVLDDPRVSRRHARLTLGDGRTLAEDLGSTNGTFVNGKRLDRQVEVHPGDHLALGRFTFELTKDGPLEQRDWRGNVSIEARGVSAEVAGARLLADVSLAVLPSELVAVMGPSGAGKTTLMSVLNGYSRPSSGTVLFNGQNLHAHYAQFQGSIGYVPQDDIMHRDLTVFQALYYTARLRLPRDFRDREIADRIAGVIQSVGLEGTEHLPIGSAEKRGISGGQRKRVNLAMELLTDPSVLFLDEPTSGLSSEDALVVIRLLRKLADEGKTIILTLHQPSIHAYRMLDNLIVVAKDAGAREPGRLAYYGPAYPQAIEFFRRPERGGWADAAPSPDDVLHGLAMDCAETWVARFAASPLKKQFVDDRIAEATPAPSSGAPLRFQQTFGFTQWWTLVRRAVAVKVKDTTNTVILLAQAPVIAALIVLVFGEHARAVSTPANWPQVAEATATSVFLMVLAAIWFGCLNAVREIVGEWAVYCRERMVCLKIPSYIASKFTVLGSLCLIQSSVLLVTVGYGASLKGPWPAMLLLLLLTSLVGLAIGLAISALARTSEVAIAVLPLVLLPLVMLAGSLLPLHRMGRPVQTLAQLMPTRWAFEGLLLLEADEREKQPEPAVLQPTDATSDAEPGMLSQKPSRPIDMAEHFFPGETHRMGVAAAAASLLTILALLLGAIYGILRWRDAY